MESWIHLLSELGYPVTSVALLLIGAFFFRQFLKTYLTTVVHRDLEEVRQRNSEQLEELRRSNSAQLQTELENLRRRNIEQLEAAKRDYAIAIEERKAALAAAADELAYVREHYAGIKEYSSAQAEALRQAYLALFEGPESSRLSTDRVESVIENVLAPLRRHLGSIDELTSRKIYAVANYLRDFKGRENDLTQKRIAFWEITEIARRFVKADKIAYRLGLVNRIMKEVEVMRVTVLEDGIPILGNYTYPHKGVEVEISEDEWMSEDVQRFVRERKIEKKQSAGDPQLSNE